MSTTNKITIARTAFSYRLIASRTANVSIRNCDENITFSFNICGFSNDIGGISDAILKLIDVEEYSEGVTYEDYISRLLDKKQTDEVQAGSIVSWCELENSESEYTIDLRKVSEQEMNISIYETSDNYNKDNALCFKADVNTLSFAKNIMSAMDMLLTQYGFQGYYDRWEYEFPLRSYLKLKSYILMSERDGILRKVVPNINFPFKLEMKMLNKLVEPQTDENEDKNLRNSR